MKFLITAIVLMGVVGFQVYSCLLGTKEGTQKNTEFTTTDLGQKYLYVIIANNVEMRLYSFYSVTKPEELFRVFCKDLRYEKQLQISQETKSFEVKKIERI